MPWCAAVYLLGVLWLIVGNVANAAPQDEAASNALIAGEQTPTIEYTEEEQRQIQLADRFLKILSGNPRRGTALDRVYGHHIEFGTLDAFIAELQKQAEAAPEEGERWMLLGLFQSQRGEDAAAVTAFQKAEQTRPDDALAAYYLSQSLLRIGENAAAVEAMERAIERQPRRADLLEIFQALGRVHQRAQRTDEALRVWQRLENLFPDDPRVLEQIAIILAEEGQPALALPRYEALAELAKDDYRRTTYRVAAAELKIKTSQRSEGIADLEAVLDDLNPDGWLYRDVRRRIEDVFLRSSDQDSLVKYYQSWLDKHPDDIEAMARLARFLSASGRVPEATELMEQALRLAPSRTDLRKSFIDQLVEQQKLEEATAQYQQLVEAEPENTDFLRDWGKLVLRDKSRSLGERREEATEIWNRIRDAHPDDALTTAQVADLFRNAEMNPQALELYQQAVRLAPNDPQYREYLGEFYHILKRQDEALQTWAASAAPPNRTADNLARVAEVYNSFGYLDQAVTAIVEACELAPKDFVLQIRGGEYLSRNGKFDAALEYVAAAESLAESDEQRSTVVAQRISILQSAQRLDDEIKALAEQIDQTPQPSTADWHLLARYQAADRKWSDAGQSVEAALQLEPKSIPVLTTAASIAEAAGDFGKAADLSRRLADSDRRSRDNHLMNVSRLEMQMGRGDEALEAARQLIVASPGNTDNYEFLAQLCFRLGKNEQGLDALRKAVRINPNEPHLIIALGSALANQLKTREAIEVYWRAFEKTDEVDDQTSLTMKLVPLYEQINQFEQLIARLERDRREDDKRREMTICLAQAYQTAGDFGTARRELESLLSEDTRDTNLLQQLAKLCQTSGDLEAAIGYQRQLVQFAPGHETEFPLVAMLQAHGDRDEATEILVKLTRREEDPARLMRSIDSLLKQESYDAVIEIVDPLVSQQRDDWELLYREAVAWASLDNRQEAATRFQRILAIQRPHDTLGRAAEAKQKRAAQKARSENRRGQQTRVPTPPSPLAQLSLSNAVQQATGLIVYNRNYYSGQSSSLWTPDTFAVARMAAYGWLLRFEQEAARDAEQGDEPTDQPPGIVQQTAEAAESPHASRETLYDRLYVASLLNDNTAVFELARRLAAEGGEEEQRFFLTSLRLRGFNSQTAQVTRSGQVTDNKTPLAEEDIERMLSYYQILNEKTDDDQTRGLNTGQVAYDSSGRMYVLINGTYQLVAGSGGGAGMFLSTVLSELRLAGREDQANEMLDAEIAKADDARSLSAAMNLALAEKQVERLPDLFQKWYERAIDEIRENPKETGTASGRRNAAAHAAAVASNSLQRWLGLLAAEEEHQQILSILDRSLDVVIAEVKRDVTAPQTPSQQRRTARPRMNQSLQSYYGENTNYVRFDNAVSGEFLSPTAVTLLRQVHESFKRNQVLDDLPEHLQTRVEKADAATRVFEQIMLATVLWWGEDQQGAIELIADAGAAFDDDAGFRFQLAQLYQQQGDWDKALELVDSVVARDQRLLQQRELAAMELAERLGDVPRARQAAERLFGLRLSSQVQLTLIAPMRRLGLSEMADAIIARAERSAGNQPTALASLMSLYRGQGKTDEAKQLAHMLLRRSASPITALSSASQNPRRYSRRDDGTRSQALQLLQQTGELVDMIEQLESQVQRSPDSLRAYELLVEYYEAAKQQDKVVETLQKALAVRPKAIGLRDKLAEVYVATGKHDEACDEYLFILKQQPAWFTNDFYRVRNVFSRAKRIDDLARGMSEVDIRLFRDSYMVINMATELLRQDPESDVAIGLLERAYDAYPSSQANWMRSLGNPKVWQNTRLFELAKKSVIPTELQIKANPWQGVDAVYSYSSDGEVNSIFHSLLESLESQRLGELKSAIEIALDKHPEWRGGTVMLALIELKADKREVGKQRLVDLLADESRLESMNRDCCWIVGQELDKFEDLKQLAQTLFEQANNQPNRGMAQLQYSPVNRLVQSYLHQGRKEDARNLILSQLAQKSNSSYNQSYESRVTVDNALFAGEKLLEIGFPIDAIQQYQGLLSDSDLLLQAEQYSGSSSSSYTQRARTGLDKAMAALDGVDAAAAIEQLLAVDAKRKPNQPVLDLLLSIPEIDQIAEDSLGSSFLDILVLVAKEAEHAAVIDRRLLELRKKFPDDLSVGISLAYFRLKTESARADEALASLVDQVAAAPLEAIAADRRPNSRQRREAALSIPLWLVAREAIGRASLESVVTPLATRAVAAARRQLDPQATAEILLAWGQALLDSDDRPAAQQKWTELLQVVTRRPARTTGEGDNVVPPLTLSQFKLAMLVADRATQHGIPELAQLAVSESLAGGLPVSDPTSGDTTPAPIVRQIVNGRIVTTTANDGDFSVQVAQRLQKVVSRWEAEGYDSDRTYALLKSIVLPPSRPQEVFMYADSSALMDAKLSSLGGLLVRWAERANKLPALDAELRKRGTNPPAKLASLVMQTQIALANQQLPTAIQLLAELDTTVDREASTETIQLACHAALPAARLPRLKPQAMKILQRMLVQFAQGQQQAQTVNSAGTGKLTRMINTYLAANGGEEKVREYYDALLMARQTEYARYSGDYGLYRQLLDVANFAEEAARQSIPTVAMEYLARVTDMQLERYSRPHAPIALAASAQYVRSLDAQQRYQTWADWTLPTDSRRTVRFVIENIPVSDVPEAFATRKIDVKTVGKSSLLCNLTELVSAAKAAKQLPDLRARAEAAVEQNYPHAMTLLILVQIAGDDQAQAETAVENWLASEHDNTDKDRNALSADALKKVLVFFTCLDAGIYFDKSIDRFETFDNQVQRRIAADIRTTMIAAYADHLAQQRGATIRAGDPSGLRHWVASSVNPPGSIQTRGWWAVGDAQLSHLLGSGKDVMYFAAPVEGNFTFTVDCFTGDWGESDASYGGVMLESQSTSSRTSVSSLAQHEAFYRGSTLSGNRPGYGRVRIESTDGIVKHYLNDYLIYEEPATGTSPWITLICDGNRATVFRNPRFEGTPRIPAHVDLLSGNQMDGWNSQAFNESQPRHRLMAIEDKELNSSVSRMQSQEPAVFDWETRDGLLTGRADESAGDSQSWLFYQRPLLDGDTFEYQFHYIPGHSVVSPTLGQMAFLLRPSGVQTHWISNNDVGSSLAGVQAHNAIDETEYQNSNALPLKSDEWNTVRLSKQGQRIVVSLNDTVIFERPWDDQFDSRFGLFHYRKELARVRQATLTGSWASELPDTLTAASSELLWASENSWAPEDRQLWERFQPRSRYQPLSAEVVHAARDMDDDAALEYLSNWVLPSDDHDRFRLTFEYVPLKDQTDMPIDSVRLDRILSPAIELLRVAGRLDRLGELRTQIESTQATDSIEVRSRLAMLALVDIHGEDAQAARQTIGQLYDNLADGLPQRLAPVERSAELLVAAEAGRSPQLWSAGLDLVQRLRQLERDSKTSSNNETYRNMLHGVWGAIEEVHARPKATADAQRLTQWTAVPYFKPQHRANGQLPTTWLYERGSLEQLPSETWNQLFFQSPLRGKYEITARHSTHGYKEVVIATGMYSVEPKYDLTATRVNKVMHNQKDIDGKIELPAWDQSADFRIAVDGNQVTTFVNGVQIHQQQYSQPLDPWLLIQASAPGTNVTVRDLRITGEPEIPDEIDLIEIEGWAAWRADMYGDWFSTDADSDAPYLQSSEEILGNLRTNLAASPLESLLMYARPMLEDGEIEFETFYKPGEFEAHPAVGRDAFLLEPTGVRLHRLTNAQWEDSDLAIDNRAPLAESGPALQLVADDWNHVKIKLSGDVVTVFVNQQQVAEKQIDTAVNERFFGLFRYSDRTQCRVRNLKYRGQWPKTLPPIEQQQLAYPAEGPLVMSEEQVDEQIVIPLGQSPEELKAAGLRMLGPQTQMAVDDNALSINHRQGGEWAKWPGLAMDRKFDRDLEFTVDFADLQFQPVEQGWGTILGLSMELDDAQASKVEVAVSANTHGQVVTRGSLRRKLPSGQASTVEHEVITGGPVSGKLRLVRRGTRIHCLLASGPEQPFQLIHSLTIGDANVRQLAIQAKTSDDKGEVAAKLKHMTIRVAAPNDGA